MALFLIMALLAPSFLDPYGREDSVIKQVEIPKAEWSFQSYDFLNFSTANPLAVFYCKKLGVKGVFMMIKSMINIVFAPSESLRHKFHAIFDKNPNNIVRGLK
jgi:hypothetical protein